MTADEIHSFERESPSIGIIFESVVEILLFEEKNVSITFSPNQIQIKLPPSRQIAEKLKIPHEYILDFYFLMEEEGLITRMKRIGIFTTQKGTERISSIMKKQYPSESAAILGEIILQTLSGNKGPVSLPPDSESNRTAGI